jgi:phosphatidylserine/phosphatidylglycerophosphate/cardiolipin synthase-like enzyme
VLHHKFAVIDHRKVIVGSHNWSDSANKQNDEALFVINDLEIANSYSLEFENLFSNSVLGTPAWLTKKISDLNKKCAGVN